MSKEKKLKQYIRMNQTSVLGAFLLSLLFGPLGMFAVSFTAGFVALLITIAVGAFTAGVGALILWPFWILFSVAGAAEKNKKVRLAAELQFGGEA